MTHTRASLEAAGMIVPEVSFEEAIQAIEGAIRQAPPPLDGVVFYGDSDIGRWQREGLFAETFAGLPVINCGFGGARIWETLIYFDRIVSPLQPRVLVYNCGDNDVSALRERSTENIRVGFQLFLECVEQMFPSVRHLICLAIHPAPARHDRGLWPLQARGNNVLRTLCATRSWASFEDANALLGADPMSLRLEDFVEDRLHYAPTFYKKLGAFLRPKLDLWMRN